MLELKREPVCGKPTNTPYFDPLNESHLDSIPWMGFIKKSMVPDITVFSLSVMEIILQISYFNLKLRHFLLGSQT